MTNTSQLGQFGENIACEYLKNKGYKIIERNYRQPWGEIDIIAVAPDKTLVFIEVKTMSRNIGGIQPEDQLTSAKLQKLQRTAQLYAGHYQEKIKDDKGWRIDLIAINIPQNLNQSVKLTDIIKNCDIKHYENVW